MSGEPVPRRSKLSKKSSEIWAALDQLKLGLDRVRLKVEKEDGFQSDNSIPMDLSTFKFNKKCANL